MQTRNTEHWGSQVLTLPWYLILSYCCWRKAGLWVPLWVVLLLPCQTEYLAVTSHPPLPTGDRTSWLLLFSLSPPRPLSLCSLFVFVVLLLVWFPCEDKTYTVRPKHQQSPLFTPSIHPPFDRSSKCPPLRVPLRVPLLPSKLESRNSSHTSHNWAEKKEC